MAKPEKNKVKNGLVFSGKSWSYVLRVPDPVTGKTKPQWVGGFDSASSAKVARDKARVALANRDYVAPTKTTLGEFLTAWIEIHARHIKPTTLDGYRKLIKNYLVPGIGSIKLQDLRPSHIEAFYSDLLSSAGMTGKGLSPSSVVRCGAVLKKALRYAVEVEGLLAINPANRVPLPKERPSTPTPWSISELRRFLEVSETHRLRFFYWLSANTGARRGELLALRWSDFDGKAITISKSRTEINGAVIEQNSTKGGANGQRRVTLDPETIERLNSHRKRQLIERMAVGEAWHETGYIFVQENGLPLYPTTVTSLFSKLSDSAGLRPIRLHDLRHIHATELLRTGENLHVVAQRLGHRDAMVTATIYAHVTSEQSETASSRFANALGGIS